GVFTLDSLAFTLYGGRQRGAVTVDLSRDVPAYTIRTTITGLDVNRALAATVNMPNVLLGTGAASGTVTGSGSTADVIERSLAGNLKLELRNGTLKNYPLLANVNQLLGITGGTGSDTRFESLTATAVIGRGRAEVPDLALQAGELRMLGRGTVKFDRMVDFRLHAILSGEKSQQFAQRLRPVGLARDAKGQIDIPITVRGSAMAPTTRVEVGTYAKQRVREEIESGLLKLFDKDRP
ncbi:MAG TPA: AsmA-like C-terminal region-containing protein, partial [Gemmatimonadales bacterium]|nr:AsmA-like C-terminal region-containing protein [Gemmatimonadales bacterium]